MIVTVLSETVQTDGVVVAKLTESAELAVALTVNGVLVQIRNDRR
jgi:hypothetical protein